MDEQIREFVKKMMAEHGVSAPVVEAVVSQTVDLMLIEDETWEDEDDDWGENDSLSCMECGEYMDECTCFTCGCTDEEED